MPHIRQCPLDTAVAPGGVLLRHADHQLFDLGCNAWSPRLLARGRRITFSGDETVIPTLEGVGCGERRHLLEACAADRVGQHSQAATLGIGEARLASLKCGVQDAVFLTEIGDDLILVAMDPAGKDGD
jgi:hypothetical protein